MVLAGQAAVNSGQTMTPGPSYVYSEPYGGDELDGIDSMEGFRAGTAASSEKQEPALNDASQVWSSKSMHFYSATASYLDSVEAKGNEAMRVDSEMQDLVPVLSSATAATTAVFSRVNAALGQETWLEPVKSPAPAHFLEDAHMLPPYKIPKNPADVYAKQTGPLMADAPKTIVYNANKFQVRNPLLAAPFEKSLKKLPQDHLPANVVVASAGSKAAGSVAPNSGPLNHPQEPVWNDLNHRLQNILQKQGRRAERRRKKRNKSKLLRGRSVPVGKKHEGKELRDYLDKAAQERTEGRQASPGEPAGEFLGKVHEQWISRRENAEAQRFQVRPTVTTGVDKYLYNMGEQSPRARRVVRPVYMPPPNAAMESFG